MLPGPSRLDMENIRTARGTTCGPFLFSGTDEIRTKGALVERQLRSPAESKAIISGSSGMQAGYRLSHPWFNPTPV